MSHDISHCGDDDCEIKFSCKRYLLHLKLFAMGNLCLRSYISCKDKEFYLKYDTKQDTKQDKV
jgi:hypothetical protein